LTLHPNWLCGSPVLSNGYQGLFPWGWSGQYMKLTTRLHLVLRPKNAWNYTSTPPVHLHNMVLCEAQGQLYLLPLPKYPAPK